MSVLSGMTGFARVAGEAEWGSWAWEAKSVNGRGLDVRVNYPPGFEVLERAIKTAAPKFSSADPCRSRCGSIRRGADRWRSTSRCSMRWPPPLRNGLAPALSGDVFASLMNVKGVVEPGASNLRDLGRDEAVIKLLSASAGEEALQALQVERQREGGVLAGIVWKALSQGMEAHWREGGGACRGPASLLKERLTKQLDELDPDGRVDKDRMAAEIALSAAKADVREELDRLSAHFASARELLAGGSPVGRKLDFLAQELNREANTLCSKSISLDLTNAGLGLKGLIDQFKEQAANVE
jgi:uncharacterized protein YicC (UPF0701 family)